MHTKTTPFIIWVAFCYCIGCTNESRIDTTVVAPILRNIQIDTKMDMRRYKAIFFVPATGCGGCISSAEDFVINSIVENSRHDILVMITGHGSKKQAISRMGREVVDYPEVFIDLKSKYVSLPFFRQYPKIIFLSEGNPISVSEIQPDEKTSVLNELANLTKQ